MNFQRLKEIVAETPASALSDKEIKTIKVCVDPETEYEYLYFTFKK